MSSMSQHKNQNIQVFVRCRPINPQERRSVVEVVSSRREVKVNERNSAEAKSFFFDQVFGPDASQIDVYKTVVRPLIDQVLLGLNCTVLAYGQTGSGKTYTLEGEGLDSESALEDDPHSGLITRAVSQLFESLKEHDKEFTVRVSFVQIYNEDTYDLLSPLEDTTKLKVSEDASKKGSAVAGDLEEVVIQSSAEIFDILKRGSAKRQTAATLLNACSSRSHTIFSVTVHIKEGSVEDEELLKIGKLNLVDLAGSENIGRSGAQDKRAREAGNINQSLLTLGRVITALVEKRPHIPYRESKLTRLLQDSLGGKTKTSIIATISPALIDLDETLSTLDYATRATKLTNKPETNQKTAQNNLLSLAYKLRTLLRLPKAHKWICYEWFYPNIDKTLLAGENDFCTCLKESFPNLKTHRLTRTEWCKVRRLMGKPRRCSQAFLAEERALLYNKRQKIRQLQQQKVVDVNYFRDLPMQIPLSLVIGTRVTALLHHPHDDLYTGIIDAVDTASHGYRITFDRPGVGTHTVPDYEVLSIDAPEFLPLNSFQTRIKPRMPLLKSPKFLEILGYQVAEALNGGKMVDSVMNNHSYMIAGSDELSTTQYPIKLLALMVRVSKILSLKKKRVYELKSMNDEVERLHSLDQEVPQELKKSYASIILDLDKLNNDLDDHLKAVQIYSNELSIDNNCIPDPNLIKQRCSAEAKEIIDTMLPDYEISNQNSIAMITHMTTLMFHLKSLSENDDSALKLKALSDTMLEYKSTLEPFHMSNYEDNIEIHVNYLINRNED